MKRFGRTAIVKPDHVGDLILAAAAIKRLEELSTEPTLFVSSQNVLLARHLFPQLDLKPLDLPHLAKIEDPQQLSPGILRETFSSFDIVFVLREDAYLNGQTLSSLGRPILFTCGYPDRHETWRHARCLYECIGYYDSDKYWPGKPLDWPSQISRVGLIAGAGFPTNRWPLWHWARLALMLEAQHRPVLLVGGPAERELIGAIAELAGIGHTQIFIGSHDRIPEMLEKLAQCDVAIASDGGAGHLASLACPILSLFTSSPYRCFAPFGRAHRLITLSLPCSPCMNSDSRNVNLCLTNECSFGILPETVLSALEKPSLQNGAMIPLDDPYGAQLAFGISHA